MDKTLGDRIDNEYSDTQRAAYYVTMTDKALSGWGRAEGRINKLIFLCKDIDEAETVKANALNRSEMKYINICVKFRCYNKGRYYTQVKTIEDYPNFYKPGYF